MRAILLLAFCAICGAQTVNVYSEFAKIDVSGKVTAPETPREILSPMLVRNGFTSFQVVIQAPAGKHWFLHVGQNPDNAVKVTMYRESGETLAPATLPIDGEGTQVFWMDLWSDKSAQVQRIKVEPELNIDNDWVIYPIEGRVVAAVVPAKPDASVPVLGCAQEWGTSRSYGSAQSVPGMHIRNAAQDSAILQQPQTDDRGLLRDNVEFKKMLASCNEPASDPERYLQIRDYLLRSR